MDLPGIRHVRRRRARSRNERAEKMAARLHERPRYTQGLVPRLLLVVAFAAVGLALLPPVRDTREVQFRAGDIADRDVIAPFSFHVPLPESELETLRAKAALSAPPVYRRDSDTENDLSRELSEAADSLTRVVSAETLDVEQRVEKVAQWFRSLPENVLRRVVRPRTMRSLVDAARKYQGELFRRGVIDNASVIRRNGYRRIVVVDGNEEKERNVGDVYDRDTIDQVIREEARRRFRKDSASAQVFYELVHDHMGSNLVYDADESRRRRNEAMSRVKTYVEVSKNQRIIAEHDRVTEEQERMLEALEKARAERKVSRSRMATIRAYASLALRLALLAFLLGAYVYVFHPWVYVRLGHLGAVFTVMTLYLVLVAVIVRFELNPCLVPVGMVAVILAALFDFRLGLVSAVFAAVLVPLVTPFDASILFGGMLSGAAAVAGVGRMRSRSHVYSVFLFITAAWIVNGVTFALDTSRTVGQMGVDMLWGGANGLFCAASVVFLLPVFETLFARTSRFALLELTDLNKPLLRRLNMEAHGTYHHSMLIANLVDAVADQVGADPLLARVMAYYHDIGKMMNPEYFTENQEGGFNRHEKITPQMSALILVAHVKDGVELAREEKLPEVVIDGIREHHGTTVMAFFYQKALETDSHSSVNRDDFRYPGPKPRSKETGLLMCADTVEAAVRSLKNPDPANIRNMVTKLIDARAQEGQLDDSGLTLSDLNVIKERFIEILTGIYHKRIAYPGQEEKPQSPGAAKGSHGESVARPM